MLIVDVEVWALLQYCRCECGSVGVVVDVEMLMQPHQQFRQYDMEVSLYEAPYLAIRIAKYDQLFI